MIGPGVQTPGKIAPVPGQAGQIPATGVSPTPGGQSPGSRPLVNQPTSSSSGRRPTKPKGLAYGPTPAAHVVPVEGKMHLPNLINKFWMRYIIIAITTPSKYTLNIYRTYV